MSNTIFHKIINREIPANIVFEDDSVVAFKDISPAAPVHILIVPKKTIATANDIENEDAHLIGQMVIVAKKIAISEGIDKQGYRLVINCNEDAGQTVFQLHLHLLGGRILEWPPG